MRETALFRRVEVLAGTVSLMTATLRALVTRPVTWPRDFVDECWRGVKLCALPVWLSIFFFHFGAIGIVGGELFRLLGTDERLAYFAPVSAIRETGPFIGAVVIAGVVGTAITADLGARKVREELDAISVLGLDPVREIVTPRFLALGVMTPLMNLVAVVISLTGCWVADIVVWGETTGGFLATFTSNFSLPDFLGAVLRSIGVGFIVAIACCYKGMHVKGGAQGVGRAVNQAVVIAFAGIWAFSNLFTATMLAAFPETGNLH